MPSISKINTANEKTNPNLMCKVDLMRESDWEKLRSIIDFAMEELSEFECETILLKFFENRSMSEIGTMYSLSPNETQAQIERALDTLLKVLAKLGVTSTKVTLETALISQMGIKAPHHLVSKIVVSAAEAERTQPLAEPRQWVRASFRCLDRRHCRPPSRSICNRSWCRFSWHVECQRTDLRETGPADETCTRDS